MIHEWRGTDLRSGRIRQAAHAARRDCRAVDERAAFGQRRVAGLASGLSSAASVWVLLAVSLQRLLRVEVGVLPEHWGQGDLPGGPGG